MSQEQAILDALKAGRELTPLEALTDFGCLRLGARIYDLKKAGVAISSRMIETSTGKHVAAYSIGEKND